MNDAALGQLGLRDGWILTGAVLAPPGVDSLDISVFIDTALAGYAVANIPLGGDAAACGQQPLGFEYVPRAILDQRHEHVFECFDPSGTLVGRLSTRLRQAKPYNNPMDFLAWAYYQRVLRGPFDSNDEICLSYFDWYASHCARQAADKPPAHVSVVMPYWNAAATVRRSIESVLAQTHAAWQLIVVDDGSDMPLDDVQASYPDQRITFVRLPSNLGPAAARNAALRLARGGYVAFLDADNGWDERFLTVMTAALDAHPERDIAYCGQYLREHATGAPVAVRMGDFNPSLIENENYIDLNCAVIRKEALDRVGGFDEAMGALEDWELFLRLVEHNAPLFVPVVLSDYTCDRSDSVNHSDRIAGAWAQVMAKQRSRPGVQTFSVDIGGCVQTFWSRPQPPAPRTRRVSIIIPSYNVASVLRVCVERLFATIDTAYADVIICDNGSDDETRAALTQLAVAYPSLTVDRADRNYGFTHAVNRGLRLADPDSDVVILNNDAIVTAGWLDALLDVRSRYADAGIIAPRQVLLPRAPAISHHAPYANQHCEIDVTLSAHHANVDGATPVHADGVVDLTFVPFFCVLITREALTAVGPLDERLGRHYRSDSIFCFALRHVAGLRILFAPQAKVYHLLQQSTQALRRSDAEAFQRIFVANRWDERERPDGRLPWQA